MRIAMEDMKMQWQALSERIGRQEIVNDRIIREMIASRASKSYNRLLYYNLFGILVALVCVPVVYALGQSRGIEPWVLAFICAGISAMAAMAVAAVVSLSKVKDAAGDIVCYEKGLNRYWRLIIAIYIVALPFLVVSFGAVIATNYDVLAAAGRMWIFAAVFPVALLLNWLEYKYVYSSQVAALRKGMRELREFEKE